LPDAAFWVELWFPLNATKPPAMAATAAVTAMPLAARCRT
jgi:hypothetical protein